MRSVLRQAVVARLPMTEQVLDDMERMLDFRDHAGLQMLPFSIMRASVFACSSSGFGALHGNMPGHSFANIFKSFLHAPDSRRRRAQRSRLLAKANVLASRRRHYQADPRPCAPSQTQHQRRCALHPEVPVIALFRLVHLSAASVPARSVHGQRLRPLNRKARPICAACSTV